MNFRCTLLLKKLKMIKKILNTIKKMTAIVATEVIFTLVVWLVTFIGTPIRKASSLGKGCRQKSVLQTALFFIYRVFQNNVPIAGARGSLGIPMKRDGKRLLRPSMGIE